MRNRTDKTRRAPGALPCPASALASDCIASRSPAGVATGASTFRAPRSAAGDPFRHAVITRHGVGVVRGCLVRPKLTLDPRRGQVHEPWHYTKIHNQGLLGGGVRKSMISKRRKLSLSVIAASALCALAFGALPAVASADPSLLTSKGKLVPVGTQVNFSSTDPTWVWAGFGTLDCTLWELHGLVEVNNGTEVKMGPSEEADVATGCTLDGFPLIVTPQFESLELDSASKTVNFVYSAGGGTITENTVPPGASVIYTGPTSTVLIEGELEGSITGTFSGHFTLLGGVNLN